ncbi:toprim domain-containing protein [Rickettsia tamurae]|uniref:toprim domain-containing protein n=1 Tax=Rickettsia tamurae TaxID=334545 RepID=UPI000A7EFA63
MFKSTNKDLQIENGEFATITLVSNDKFVAKTDSGKEIEFNPQDVSFKHGYASTVYKAQGASIKDVYVLHNLAGNSRNSYVAMTRHIEEVKLYYNKDSTRNIASLIWTRSSYNLKNCNKQDTTISIKLQEDIMAKKKIDYNAINKQEAVELKQRLSFKAEEIGRNLLGSPNKHLSNSQLLRWEKDGKIAMKINGSKVGIWYDFSKEEGGDLFTLVQRETQLNKIDNRLSSINFKTLEELVAIQDQENKSPNIIDKVGNWFKGVVEDIKDRLHSNDNYYHLRVKLEPPAKVAEILGSTSTNLATSHKVQEEQNCDFVEAKKYLQDMVSISTKVDEALAVNLSTNKKRQIKTQTEQESEMAKIKRAEILYEKSDSIKYSMPNNVATRYLSEHRGIEKILTGYQLSNDLRTNMMWDSNSKQYYPALIAFARNKDGNITGGQSIYLNKDTNNKANIEVNKRSFGRIRGSFVEINKNNEQQNVQSSKDGNNSVSNITIIAEGVETALSIAEAGIKGKILCSLGVSNIRNYEPIKGERIIIAADNDGKDAVSVNTVIKAQEELIRQGATVAIIRPPEKGDFNDMLKSQGVESIDKLIEPEIIKLTAASNAIELKSSLKTNDNRKSQFQSIELLFSKFANNDNNELNNLQQQQITALAKFGTEENINTAIQIYREKGIDSCMLYSNKICIAAIEQKIKKDLQIMQNKFDPNYNLGDKRFCDIVVHDFQGKSHLVPEDYLNTIGRDKQVMQYISPSSEIAKEIKSAVKQVSEVKLSQGIRV